MDRGTYSQITNTTNNDTSEPVRAAVGYCLNSILTCSANILFPRSFASFTLQFLSTPVTAEPGTANLRDYPQLSAVHGILVFSYDRYFYLNPLSLAASRYLPRYNTGFSIGCLDGVNWGRSLCEHICQEIRQLCGIDKDNSGIRLVWRANQVRWRLELEYKFNLKTRQKVVFNTPEKRAYYAPVSPHHSSRLRDTIS